MYPDLPLAAHELTKDLVVSRPSGGPPKGTEQDIAAVPATCHPLGACIRGSRYVTHNGANPTPASTLLVPDEKQITFAYALFSPKGAAAPGVAAASP